MGRVVGWLGVGDGTLWLYMRRWFCPGRGWVVDKVWRLGWEAVQGVERNSMRDGAKVARRG